jgi:hypothetical protein
MSGEFFFVAQGSGREFLLDTLGRGVPVLRRAHIFRTKFEWFFHRRGVLRRLGR